MEHLTHFFLSFVRHAGYPGLFLVMILGNIGIPVGTELVVAAAGALLVKAGDPLGFWLVGGVATAGEVVGAAVLYAIGYFGGRPFVERWGKYMGLSLHKLALAEAFYERHGRKTVFICRFIPVIRGIASLPAGISRMQKRYFLSYSAIGSGMFCFGLALLGRRIGEHFYEIVPYLHKISTSILIFVVLGALVLAVIAYTRKKASA